MSRRTAAIGIDSDRTFVHFLAECRVAGFELDAINLRQVAADGGWRIAAPEDGTSRVWQSRDGPPIELSELDAVYCRPIDLTPRQSDEAARVRWRGMMHSIVAWLHTARGLVVNRPLRGSHNSVKPLHEVTLAREGLDVPASLTSSDREALTDFVAAGRAVVKACSGTRGNTREITVSDLEGFSADRGPLHVQRLVDGDDARVHVVGDELFAVRIASEHVDYRRGGARYEQWTVPSELAASLTRATAAMGLSFAGWDLKLDSDGRAWALEANPMPGYSHYDRHLDGQISRSLMRYLEVGAA